MGGLALAWVVMGGAFFLALLLQFGRYRRLLRPITFDTSDPQALHYGPHTLRLSHTEWRVTHVDAKTRYIEVTTTSGNNYNRFKSVAYEPVQSRELRVVGTDGELDTAEVSPDMPVQPGDVLSFVGLWRIGDDGERVYIKDLLTYSYALSRPFFTPLVPGYLWWTPMLGLLSLLEVIGKIVGLAFTIVTSPVMFPIRIYVDRRLRRKRKHENDELQRHLLASVVPVSPPVFLTSN